MYSQDADADMKTHQKQVDQLKDVAKILLQELAAGWLFLFLVLSYVVTTKTT